jgi:hypothetical protein
MTESEEIKLRNAFFQAIMEFFQDHTPFPIEGLSEPIADLTDKLIDAYANTKGLDTNRTNSEE